MGNPAGILSPKKFSTLVASGLFNGSHDTPDAELVCTVHQIFDKAYKEFKNQLLILPSIGQCEDKDNPT